jgi:hypothetical protein
MRETTDAARAGFPPRFEDKARRHWGRAAPSEPGVLWPINRINITVSAALDYNLPSSSEKAFSSSCEEIDPALVISLTSSNHGTSPGLHFRHTDLIPRRSRWVDGT